MHEQLIILLPNNVPLEMILVHPGYFIMGDEAEYADGEWEGPENLVHITQTFYIGKYLVTQAQWQAVMGNNPSVFLGLQRPVEFVSWEDIVERNKNEDDTPTFLALLNKHLAAEKPELAVSQAFRLPTEAEWEYAAKGGPMYTKKGLEKEKSANLYPTYPGGDRLRSCSNFHWGNDVYFTEPVGLKQPNELGLYDLSGNVSEWCEDWFDGKAYKARTKRDPTLDPVGPTIGDYRALRGGSNWERFKKCRSSARDYSDPSSRTGRTGFRLVLSFKVSRLTKDRSGELAGNL